MSKSKKAIEVWKLTKRYGDLVAVNNLSLEIKNGEIFGLLGPNGAGKTTLISVLSTLLRPSSGNAKVNGYDVRKSASKVRSSIGLVFQDSILDLDLSALNNLDFHGRLYGMPKDLREKRIDELIKLVDLTDFKKKKVETFSGGMKRKLEIARGLMHNPSVLFLDEPTLGLDPKIRKNIWDYILDLRKKEKMTIFLTTHYMDEADFLCDRVSIIDKGKIIVSGTPKKLKGALKGDVVTIKMKNDREDIGRLIKKARSVKKFEIVDNQVVIYTTKAETKIAGYLAEIAKAKGIVDEILIHKPTLEDVFMHYTGREIGNG
ncbi:MAG: ATP-binding cassette domain-containing protein [Nanoarchaeota archaeon]|nr:ATP-binding cassette domain-containing protein [Nanoarchaeota archaeon]MBU1051991.1 ATP-binding cassette domain-containing protein [Nanoarchaeota archaeon]MBU1988251.1 ATP-binding cassette domain-containing protein [Nanoarchaeota archaeon]